MCFNKEEIEKKAREIILSNPDRIKESYNHRPGASYVKIGIRHRVYFHKENGKIIFEGIFVKPWFRWLKNFFKRGF